MLFWKHPYRLQVALFLGYVLLAIIITFPLILNISTQVIGGTTGDNYEMLRNIWWFKFALQNGEPLYYQTYMGYPSGFSSIALAANQLQYLSAYALAFVMPLAMAYNVTMLLTIALNGWAMSVLARSMLGADQWVSAWVAGVVFACAPTFQGHLFEGHGGLMVQYPVPLFAWALFRLIKTEKHVIQWTLASTVFFNLSPSGHMLQVFYMLMPFVGMFLLGLWWRKDWRGIRRVVIACALASVFMVIFLAPIIADTLKTSAYTDAGGVVRYSSDLLAIVSPSFLHPMWRVLPYPAQVLGVNIGEGVAYVGIIVGVLIILALWKDRHARWWMLFAFVCWVLSLGSLLKFLDKPIQLNLGDFQTYIPLPWALVQDVVGFSLARTPGRFNFALAFAVAMLAGYGVRVLWQVRPMRPAWQYGAVALLCVGIVFDYQFFFPVPTRPAEIPSAVYDLRQRDDVRAVFDVPWQHLLAAKDGLYLQTAHEKPLIAGQITRQTPVDPAKLNVLQNSLSPELLRLSGADVVIFHKDRAREIGLYETLQAQLGAWGTLQYEDVQIAIFDVPDTPNQPQAFLQAQDGGQFETAYITDFYMPTAGWVDFNALAVADGRDVTLVVNGQAFRRWTITGETLINVPIPLPDAGFQRIELRLDAPCPVNRVETLTCRSLTIADPYLAITDAQFLRPQIPYERGVTLVASSTNIVGNSLEVRLWWNFDTPLAWNTDVRFVHILDSQGKRMAQKDESLGDFVGKTEWVETVRLPLDGITSGEYSVRVGWYTYPNLLRFAVLDDDLVGASDNAPEVTTFSLP
jgi:hypothetical protein